MKRKYFSALLMGALTIASVSTFTSCKDYDDDISGLQSQIDQLKKTIDEINSQITAGSILTDVVKNDNGITVKLSNGKTYDITMVRMVRLAQLLKSLTEFGTLMM